MRWFVLLALMATAHAQDETARDLTVWLFDTDRVASLIVTPLGANATWKPCAGCASRPLTGARTIGFTEHPNVTLSGNVRVETETHRRAAAFGVWRIDGERDSLRLRVTVPSERYVAAVLAAEASGDEPPAALRALAVVVRSYALTHKGELTDSTSTQTLRLGVVSEAVTSAVRETAGETLWFRGRQVPGYFTQSSGGTTESSAAAWGGELQPWLPTQPDPASERSLSQWHSEIPLANLRAALAGQGYPVKSPIREVIVEQRSASGRAARVLLNCEADRLEMRASTFRFAVDRALGWNRLRSDLYNVHTMGTDAVFEGRGYGHGVGLSQTGARALALEGKDTGTILRTYFPGAEVRMTANDSGWQRHEGAGWTLVSGVVDEEPVRVGDLAWRKAVALLTPRTRVHPEVRLYPTMALFRGVTGEPGWTLAATRDDRIALQPAALLVRNHLEELLLHEMLHVLVEHEARGSLPLWFREGLVEALSEPSGEAGSAVPLAEIETRLEDPASLVEARRAHREAAAVVRQLMRVYGEAAVVGWVYGGLPGDALGRVGIR